MNEELWWCQCLNHQHISPHRTTQPPPHTHAHWSLCKQTLTRENRSLDHHHHHHTAVNTDVLRVLSCYGQRRGSAGSTVGGEHIDERSEPMKQWKDKRLYEEPRRSEASGADRGFRWTFLVENNELSGSQSPTWNYIFWILLFREEIESNAEMLLSVKDNRAIVLWSLGSRSLKGYLPGGPGLIWAVWTGGHRAHASPGFWLVGWAQILQITTQVRCSICLR